MKGEPAPVAVGTPVSRRPPHRSQRAALPHWAPTSGHDDKARCLAYPYPRTDHVVFPVLSPGRVLRVRVPLGPAPSLHTLRRRTGFVRALHRYYGSVRLPTLVRHRITPSASRCVPGAIHRGRVQGLPVLVRGASMHAQGLGPRGAGHALPCRRGPYCLPA